MKSKYRIHKVAFAVASGLFFQSEGYAERLDMSFIHGGSSLDVTTWNSMLENNIPGRYLVTLILNETEKGRYLLDITKDDGESICFSESWLKKSGVFINPDFFKSAWEASRECYVLNRVPSVTVNFDISTQSLSMTLPQAGMASQTENMDWDYGTTALRANYNINTNTSRYGTSTFGFADLKANVGGWVINSSGTVIKDGNTVESRIAMFTASRALQSLKADLLVGKTYTGSALLGSVETYGVMLSRNNNMTPGNIGYSPEFSGIANSYARVTLTQGNNTLYSEVVPPGPFTLKNVVLLNSGDVTMRITEENGSVSTQVFPLTVMSGQLSPGQHEFTLSAGVPDENSKLNGGVVSAEYGSGINRFTFRGGTVFHPDYLGASFGMVADAGVVGALSAEGAWARAKYLNRTTKEGLKSQLSWSKKLDSTATGLRLGWSRQLTERFQDLNGFDPSEPEPAEGRNIKNEWSAGISQPVKGVFSVGLSGWKRDYWNNDYYDTGLNTSLGTQIKGINLNVGGTYYQRSNGERNYGVSLSVSVPFTLFERNIYSGTTITNNKGSGTSVNTGLSGSVTERLSMGVSTGRSGSGNLASSATASYNGDRAGVSASLAQSGENGTSGAFSVSGSVLGVPAARSMILSRNTGDTLAVININKTPGVRLLGKVSSSDDKGNLVVPLNSYAYNTLTVDAGSLPLDTELETTSKNVVPAEQAVVWMPFEPLRVQRYLLQLRHADGKFVAGGTWAFDERRVPLGFVANNGILAISAVELPGQINLGNCIIPAGRLKETHTLQEVICEK